MSKLLENFKSSAKELTKLQNLVLCALLMACTVALGMVTTIYVTPDIKIGFSFLASELAYLLFGPVVGMFYGGAADVLKFFVKPVGPFFPGYTLDAMLSGFLYGMFLYKKPIKLWRIAVARAVVVILVNTLLAAYWRHVTGGNPYSVVLTTMATKNLIMYPINTGMFFITLKALQATGIKNLFFSHVYTSKKI